MHTIVAGYVAAFLGAMTDEVKVECDVIVFAKAMDVVGHET